MKNIFLINYLLLLLPFSDIISQSNINTGIVEYNQILVNDTIINNLIETKGILYFNIDERKSVYHWNRKNKNYKREFQKTEDGRLNVVLKNGKSGTDSIGRVIYKDYNSNISQIRERIGQWYIVTDTVAIKWVIENERKNFNNMILHKAVGDFRGRRYIAWFNPDIPVPDGPWKLRGLPGLIIEAYDEKKHVRFEFLSITIPGIFDDIIKVPVAGEPMNFSVYQEKKLKNMEDRYLFNETR